MTRNKSNCFYSDFYLGWKYYNIIRKKAMEQEFSWSGLIVSLSIAFFIVSSCAMTLDFLYGKFDRNNESLHNPIHQVNNEAKEINDIKQSDNKKVAFGSYQFEKKNILEFANKVLGIKQTSAALLDYSGSPEKFTLFLDITESESRNIEVKFKNTGLNNWKKKEVFLETGPFLKAMSLIKHSSWLKYYQPVALENDVAPGADAIFKFKALGPTNLQGTIQENFQLTRNSQVIPGTLTRIFIDVKLKDQSNANIAASAITSNSAKTASETPSIGQLAKDFCTALSVDNRSSYEQCNTSAQEEPGVEGSIKDKFLYPQEPSVRVGIFSSPNAQRITCESHYDVFAGSEMILSGLVPSDVAIASYDLSNGRYAVTIGNITKFASSPLRFVARIKNAVFTLKDYKNGANYDNQFRNILEFNYSTKTKKLWVINELPIEFYLKGLGETSNNSHFEFQKALISTARTYVMYHYGRGVEYKIPDGSTKHSDEHFHVDATYDQVYRGYLAEKRAPNLVRAVDNTRGNVLTYNDKIVVTPYFSRSDGRTRSWEEVWGGSGMPWLKSVQVIQDKGQTLWGHGVGMSARGALLMAQENNKTWQQILYYFYQGTKLLKIYE